MTFVCIYFIGRHKLCQGLFWRGGGFREGIDAEGVSAFGYKNFWPLLEACQVLYNNLFTFLLPLGWLLCCYSHLPFQPKRESSSYRGDK